MTATPLPDRVPMPGDSPFGLRRMRPGDLTTLVEYRSDPRVARYQSWDTTWGEAQAKALFETDQTMTHVTPGQWLQLIVEEQATGAVAGDVAVRFVADQRDTAEIGITLSPLYQRRGAATASLSGLLGWLFDELETHRVFAVADERNRAVRRLLDRLGFRQEGSLVDATWFKGEWTTSCLYAILRNEWRLTPRSWPGRSRMSPGRRTWPAPE